MIKVEANEYGHVRITDTRDQFYLLLDRDEALQLLEQLPGAIAKLPVGVSEKGKADMRITLKWDGDSGDRKSAFVIAEENDGWKDLRIEVDTDDCDREHAKAMMEEVIKRCNAANPKD